jgi:hypothetical protein
MKARREKADLSVGSDVRGSDSRFLIVVSEVLLSLPSIQTDKSI